MCRKYPLQLWERRLDTKALIAWNQKTVVLSFRGTATFSNVLADLSVSRIECTWLAMVRRGQSQARHAVSHPQIAGRERGREAAVLTSGICMQAWYAAHPPKRGIPLISRPYVHQVCKHCSSNSVSIRSVMACSSSRPLTLKR